MKYMGVLLWLFWWKGFCVGQIKAPLLRNKPSTAFDVPRQRLDSVIKKTGNIVILCSTKANQVVLYDTIYNHYRFGNSKLSLDTLNVLYPHVKLIGFDQKPLPKRKKMTTKR